jgi:hypothetical protein
LDVDVEVEEEGGWVGHQYPRGELCHDPSFPKHQPTALCVVEFICPSKWSISELVGTHKLAAAYSPAKRKPAGRKHQLGSCYPHGEWCEFDAPQETMH